MNNTERPDALMNEKLKDYEREQEQAKGRYPQAGDAMTACAREKHWSELSIEEKIERNREQTKRQARELEEYRCWLEAQMAEFQNLSQRFLIHRHADAGDVMIPASQERQFLEANLGRISRLDKGHGHIVGSCPTCAPDPDKVYF